MLSLFRSKPPTIPTHAARIADLGQRIDDAERDLSHAEERARDVAIDGGDLNVITDEIVRTSATISALRAAKSQVEAELADLREREAEEKRAAQKAEAQKMMLDLVAEMEATAEQAKPYLHKISGLVQTADRWLETFASQNVSPLLYGMDGAIGTLRSMASQVRMSAKSITAPVDEHGARIDTAARVLAHPHNG